MLRQLRIRPARFLRPGHALGQATHLDLLLRGTGIRTAHARRQVVRHVCILCLHNIHAPAVGNAFHSNRRERLVFMDKDWKPEPAAGRVCKMRHSLGAGQIHGNIRVQPAPPAQFPQSARTDTAANGANRAAKRNGVGPGLHGVLPDALPRGHERQCAFCGLCRGAFLRCRRKVQRHHRCRH